MRYTAHTDESLNKLNLLSEGTHDFEIVETNDKPSSKGNDMITLKLHVFEDDGTPRIVFDYLGDFMPHKFKHAADACGLTEEYMNGTLTHELFLSKCGKCTIATQPARGEFLEKSVVKDYVKRDSSAEPIPPKKVSVSKDLDDEIPF